VTPHPTLPLLLASSLLLGCEPSTPLTQGAWDAPAQGGLPAGATDLARAAPRAEHELVLLRLTAAALRSAQAMVALLEDMNEEALSLTVAMGELAVDAADVAATEEERAGLQAQFEEGCGRLDALSQSTWGGEWFAHYEDGTVDVRLPYSVQDSLTGDVALRTVDLSCAYLGLTGRDVVLTAAAAAQDAQAAADAAVAVLRDHRSVIDWDRGVVTEALGRVDDVLDETPGSSGDVQVDLGLAAVDHGHATASLCARSHRATRATLARMVALAQAAADGDADERDAAQDAFLQHANDQDRLAQSGEYGGTALHDGTTTLFDLFLPAEVIEAGVADPQLRLSDLRATVLGMDTGSLSLVTVESANAALNQLAVAEDRLDQVEHRLSVDRDGLDEARVALAGLTGG